MNTAFSALITDRDPKRLSRLERRIAVTAPHLLNWNGQGNFPGWFRANPLAGQSRTVIDPDRLRHFHETLRDKKSVPETFRALAASSDVLEQVISSAYGQQFASVGNYQRSTATQLPMGLGYTQADFIGLGLMREFVGGLDLKAEYPVYGTEMFEVIGSTKKQFGSKSDRVDINIDWVSVTCEQHHKETVVEAAERAAGAYLPQGIDTTKSNVLLTQLRTEKEVDIAAVVGATASYHASNSETLTGTDQWDHADSDPINDVLEARNLVRRVARTKMLKFWMGEDVCYRLQRNPKIVESVKYTGTKLSPGAIVPPEGLVALFMMEMLVGGAAAITTPGGTLTDIWGQDAGLIADSGDVVGQRFGLTVTTLGYPDSLEYLDQSIGTKGATVIKHSDAYKLAIANNRAGFLWKSAVNA